MADLLPRPAARRSRAALFGGTMTISRMPSTLLSLSAGTFSGPGAGPSPAAGCGKAVENARLVRDVAFDLLHDLVDVAVEHGHRAEPLQVATALAARPRSPSPIAGRSATSAHA